MSMRPFTGARALEGQTHARSALDSNAVTLGVLRCQLHRWTDSPFSGHHGPWVPDEFREHTGMVDLGADGDHRTYRIISKESAERSGDSQAHRVSHTP
jgi:hypothetical protein